MKINKALAKRIFGKVKQDNQLPYQFHINIRTGAFNRSRIEILDKLMDDLTSWFNGYGVVIEITNKSMKQFGGLSFIVRDYRAIELIAEASKGYYKGQLI